MIKGDITLYAKWYIVSLKMKKVKTINRGKALKLYVKMKVNGKTMSDKNIVFLFNGKTYTAKTNKKGIAAVKIPKSVTKKLKKVKKMTIKASFNKVTVKQTVKVK